MGLKHFRPIKPLGSGDTGRLDSLFQFSHQFFCNNNRAIYICHGILISWKLISSMTLLQVTTRHK
jgi:hypothetical protein